MFHLSLVLNQVAASVLLQSDKVEGYAEPSFMSEQASVYLGSVGLLGEYSRLTRKRHKVVIPCMHKEPITFFGYESSRCSTSLVYKNTTTSVL